MHVRIVASPSHTGTITATGGSSGTERLRRPRGVPGSRRAPRRNNDSASSAADRSRAATVLDGEHAGVTGGAARQRGRIGPVVRSRE